MDVSMQGRPGFATSWPSKRKMASRRAASATSAKGSAMSLPKLRIATAKGAPPDGPQLEVRRDLAAAIERRNVAQRQLDETRKALAHLDEVRFSGNSARKAVDLARQRLEEAKENAARYLAAKIGGTAGDPPQSVREARAALQEATDALETERNLHATLEAQLESDKRSVDLARMRVRDRIAAVVGADPTLRRLYDEFEDWRRSMAQRAELFHYLFSMLPREFQDFQAIKQFHPRELADETGPWRTAIAELEGDSNAPLPSV